MSWPQSVQGAEGSSCSCGFVRASVPFQVALSTGFVLPHHGRPALLSRRALAGIYTCGRLYVQLDFKNIIRVRCLSLKGMPNHGIFLHQAHSNAHGCYLKMHPARCYCMIYTFVQPWALAIHLLLLFCPKIDWHQFALGYKESTRISRCYRASSQHP